MEHFFLETTFGKINCYKSGAGPKKLVLLHGAGCDNALLSWRDVMERLYYDSFTVYAFDMLGYGKSDCPGDMAGGDFYQKHVRSLEECFRQLELGDFILAGLSMGGAIAISYTIQNPDQVSALFLIDSWGLTERLKHHRLIYRWCKKEKRMQKAYHRLAKNRKLVQWMIGYSLFGNKDRITPELVDQVWEACKGKNAAKSMHQYQISSLTKEICVPYYTREDWERLPMAVYFLHGELDPLVPAADARRAAGAAPMGKYVRLPGCRHWSVRENPFVFIELLEELCRQDGMIRLSEDEDWSQESPDE